MFGMSVESVSWVSDTRHLVLLVRELQVAGFCQLLSNNLVLGCDNCNLHGIALSLDRDSFLHIIVSLLHSVEANNLVRRHAVAVFRQ